MKTNKRWTPEEINYLLWSRDPHDVAQHTGRTIDAVYQKMFALDVKSQTLRGTPKIRVEDRPEIVRKYLRSERSLQSIANEYGVSRHAISDIINNYYAKKEGYIFEI
jgi:DNA invertase Pin-like site-specific DNA recombinase